MRDDVAIERRLSREAEERLGLLGDRNDYTDACQVEVSWQESNGYERAGHYIVLVRCPDNYSELSEDEQLDNHPATLANAIVDARLEERAERFGWTHWQIDDTYAA